MTTIGVKVNKKTIQVADKELSMLLWDIAGEVSQDKVPASYFLGASGVVYVIDLSRPSTMLNMANDIQFLKDTLPDCVIMIVANKKDLVTPEAMADLFEKAVIKWDFSTSAKTGENIETMFLELGKRLIDNHW
jgi:small GTP-binding protein